MGIRFAFLCTTASIGGGRGNPVQAVQFFDLATTAALIGGGRGNPVQAVQFFDLATTAALIGGGRGNPVQAVQFFDASQRCLQLSTDDPSAAPKEREALAVATSNCSPTSSIESIWLLSLDPLGNPQIQTYASETSAGLCINDDSVKCNEGNAIFLHACQGGDRKVHTANHFEWDAKAGSIVATFCPGSCLKTESSGHVLLGACTDVGAHSWTVVNVTLPPTPAPTPLSPLPPLPPLPPAPREPCTDCPNIVFVLTDDQDQQLGGSFPQKNGVGPMAKTKKLMAEGGVTLTEFFIHTPVCCPSRAETLTGRYLHNVKLPIVRKECGAAYNGDDSFGNACCMHVDEYLVNNRTFALYLQRQGYRVGMFGKYLNVCPETPPPGYDAWFANGGGTYTSPSFAVKNIDGLSDGMHTFTGTGRNYSTSLIGNHSLAWIRKVATDESNKGPWLAYIGTKACHDPFIPAPWYSDTWDLMWPKTAPRPPSYNVSQAALAKHHPTISTRPPFNTKTAQCSDTYFQNRWRTLLSVDDIIGDLYALLDELDVRKNTYVIYTSDHGYSLGELNLNWDKRNVYDFDTRIHFLATGPGIAPRTTRSFAATNSDIAPTILAMAGLPRMPGMDGRSFFDQLLQTNASTLSTTAVILPGSVQRHLAARGGRGRSMTWRTEHFVEYYYVGLGSNCGAAPIELPDNNFIALRSNSFSPDGHTYLYAEFDDGKDGTHIHTYILTYLLAYLLSN